MNPFKKDGYMLPIASINSVYIDDTLASDLFSPKLLIDEIDKKRVMLGMSRDVEKHELLLDFNQLLADENTIAETIAYKYANNLSKVLLTLKKPSSLSKINREDWTNEHWDYWKRISKIYLVGGLTSVELNKIFMTVFEEKFNEESLTNFSVEIIPNSSNYGTLGLLKKNKNKEVLLFDFGQSFIKRAYTYLDKKEVKIDKSLPALVSKFIEHKGYSNCDLRASAKTLHDYIVSSIISTIKTAKFTGSLIEISIANYIMNGKIYDSRGGYAKLTYLADNYEEFLKKSVSKKLNMDVELNLYHDTTSMSFMFDKNSNEAVISLGTGFGVSFLD